MATPAIEIFRDFAKILAAASNGIDLATIEVESLAGQLLVANRKEHLSFAESVLLTCQQPEAEIGHLLFGSLVPTLDKYSAELFVSDQSQSLRLHLALSADSCPERTPANADTMVLYTDFQAFTLAHVNAKGSMAKNLARYTASEISDEISFSGSLWASVFPEHFAIVTRTISCTFPQSLTCSLFSARVQSPSVWLRRTRNMNADMHDQESIAYRRLGRLGSTSADLFNLEDLCKSLQEQHRSPKLLSKYRQGSYTFTRFLPERSGIFDFGDSSVSLSRNDYVTSYNTSRSLLEFHREFFLMPKTWDDNDEDLRLAAFDVLHLLAIRRTKLFRASFSRRIYTILMPPCILRDTTTAFRGFALFPCLILYRLPEESTFRRTFSLTFIASPIAFLEDACSPTSSPARTISLRELHTLIADLKAPIAKAPEAATLGPFAITGPLHTHLCLPPSEQMSLPNLFNTISSRVIERVLDDGHLRSRTGGDGEWKQQLLNSILFTSNRESTTTTIMLQVGWQPLDGGEWPWERWLASDADKTLCDALFKSVFYRDYLYPNCAYRARGTTNFSQLSVGNALGGDMMGLTLYDPHGEVKFIFYAKGGEQYPNYSMTRWMAWEVYIDSALASMRSMIGSFHAGLDEQGDLRSFLGISGEMLRGFIELYELDINEYNYRLEYGRLRKLLQVDEDYDELMSKVASAREDASLREQRLINKLLVALTSATVAVAMASTIAAHDKWNSLQYSVFAIAVSVAVVLIGYSVFDRVRRMLDRIRRTIVR